MLDPEEMPDWVKPVFADIKELQDYATELEMTDFMELGYLQLTEAIIAVQRKKLDELGLGRFR